jgi:hypothetical protein
MIDRRYFNTKFRSVKQPFVADASAHAAIAGATP